MEFDAIPINPIWLQRTVDTGYRIIDGFRIIGRLWQKKESGTIPALIFDSNESKYELWKLKIQKRLAEGNFPVFPIVEQFYRLAEPEKFESDAVLVEIFHKAKVPIRKFGRSLVRKLSDNMPAINTFSNINELGYGELQLLGGFTTDEIDMLAVLFHGQFLKGNKLSSILQLIKELKNGFGILLRNICADRKVNEIINGPQNSPRYRLLKSYLTLLRYPVLNRSANEWKKAKADLKLPAEMQVINDPCFEADTLKFILEVDSAEKLEKTVRWIGEKLREGKLARLFDFV